MGFFSAPKVQGPSQAQLDAQAKSEESAKLAEERANKQLSSASRFAVNRRTGRRLLLAPGREDEISQLKGNSSANSGGNF